MELSDLYGKKIALLGVGLENVYLADFLLKNEIKNFEFRDKRSAQEIIESLDIEKANKLKKLLEDHNLISGDGYLNELTGYDVVFRTPGIPFLAPEIQNAKEHGVLVSSQIKLFFDLCSAKIVGVTGTKGKGTTSKLIESILKKSYSGNIYLLGNIGYAAIDYLDKINPDDIVILELSSFQLQDLEKSPHVAVITNLGEDHLNYHKDLSEYWQSKANIFKYQSKDDFAIINQDYLTAVELAAETLAKTIYFSGKNRVENGAYVKEIKNQISKIKNVEEVILTMAENDEVVCRSDELKIVGNHNMQNIAAAAIVGKIFNIKTEDIHDVVTQYTGLEHRLEHVAEINGVDYYNDSYATNPISTSPALKAFTRPIIAILGGSEKGTSYNELVDEIIANQYIKAIVYIGETGEKIARILRDKKFQKLLSPGGQKMEEIVDVASRIAESGDVVVLSPASASFGLFKNYKDRGEQFKQAVNNILER